jgi:DNA gyrase subunit B
MSDTSYTGADIVVLTAPEAIRKRPGMYLGSVDSHGLHHLLWEVVGNVIDQHLGGHASRMRIQIDGHQISVEDDGDGIPVDPVGETGKTVLELVMTEMCASGLRRPHVHLGARMHGIGLVPVNALCERLEVEVWRAGRAYVARFARGVLRGAVEDLGPTARHGSRLTLVPDFTILDRVAWDRAVIGDRLRELAALNPALTLVLDHETYRCSDGLSDLVRHHTQEPWSVPIRLRENHAGEVDVDVALQWTDRAGSAVHGFVGQSRGGGVHVEALRWGLVQAVRGLDEALVRVNAPALFEVVGRGLVAAVSVALEAPRFGNPSRDWLENPEVGAAVRTTVAAGLSSILATDHALRDRLLARIPR